MLSAREAWFDSLLDLDPETLIFVDETGASTKMARRHGRALLVASRFAWPSHTATG